MLPKINPANTQAWLLLTKHQSDEMRNISMKRLFAEHENRFKKFSLSFGDILFDYSKNIRQLLTCTVHGIQLPGFRQE